MPRSTHDLASVDRFTPVSRRAAATDRFSPVMILLTLLATVGCLAYGVFLLQPSHRGDLIPWLLVVVSEAILVLHALCAMWTVLAGTRDVRDHEYWRARDELYPLSRLSSLPQRGDPSRWPLQLDGRRVDVDVLITVFGEPLEVVRRTATAAMAIRGRHEVWILDDGRSDEVRALAAQIGCRYVRRLSGGGAKAGNVNHALTLAKSEFFVILDADFVPLPGLLEETLPFFTNETVAFVQTPQTYGNLHNVISRGAGYMQAMFYRFIQPGRNHFNAAFCVGTNVVFRRRAIDDIGGMVTDSKSEDVWTSLTLHERGWRSIFLPTTLAIGDAPDTIVAYSKQQLRWATGGFEILLQANPLSPRRRLSLDQRLMYFITATHYLTGIVPGVLLMVPALEVFFDLRPVSMDVGWGTWVVFYGGFYVLQIVLAFFTLGSFRWEVLTLAACSFPIYTKALVNAVTGRDQAWSVTGAQKQVSPFTVMGPQVCMLVFLLCTTAVGIWRDTMLGRPSIATLWCAVNSAVLLILVVVALGEIRAARTGSLAARADRAKVLATSAALAAPIPLSTPADAVAARHARTRLMRTTS